MGHKLASGRVAPRSRRVLTRAECHDLLRPAWLWVQGGAGALATLILIRNVVAQAWMPAQRRFAWQRAALAALNAGLIAALAVHAEVIVRWIVGVARAAAH